MEYRPLGRTGVQVSKLRSRRDDVVLATKFWGQMGDDPNRRGVSRRWIIAEVENSLRRLGTDWIDLYQMHRPDPHMTSAIIGPRTMEQLDSQLPAADVVLDLATLDRVDQIVRPGVDLNPADTSYGEQVLQPALRRR